MAVLSIQSHVVYGYAGNTAAVFPLQRLGEEVWAVNTVEFSNHTGYKSWRGKVLGAELVADLVTGLEERGVLNRCGAVLSGYLGDADTGNAIIEAVKKVKKENPNALYCCDPVMGDIERGFYVKPDIPDIFKKLLIPSADIVCPNQFELEALTGISVSNLNDAVSAIKILHEMGPSIVLVTSYKEKDDEIGMIASVRNISNGNKQEIFKIITPELSLGSSVAGLGDMTAAVFLSHYLKTRDLQKTLEFCTASVYSILAAGCKLQTGGGKTIGLKSGGEVTQNNPPENKLYELKFIEAQGEFDAPSYFFKAEKINL